MTAHLSELVLHDYADAELAPDARAVADAHLAACGECRSQLGRIRALAADARALPRSIEPPPAVWTAVRAAIADAAQQPSGEIAHDLADARSRKLAVRRRLSLAAAALLLVAASSGITAWIMRSPQPRGEQAATYDSVTLMRPVSDVERRFAPTVAQLEAALAARRDSLSPETIRTVEASLRAIDAALAEARDALARDPGDGELRELLTETYERKLEFLRRADRLVSRS